MIVSLSMMIWKSTNGILVAEQLHLAPIDLRSKLVASTLNATCTSVEAPSS